MSEILIVGGGVAGCAAALSLERAGVQSVVFESHPTSTEDLGAFLIIQSGGVQVLSELGVLESVDEYAVSLSEIHIQSPDGSRTFARRPLATSGSLSYRLVSRGRLCQILQEHAVSRGIQLRRDVRIDAVSGDLGSSRVTLEDGSIQEASLVIGADGLRSRLRSAINRDGAEPRYVGQRLFWGFNADTSHGELGSMHVAAGEGSAFGYIPTDRGTSWFARVTGPELTRDELLDPDFGKLLFEHLVGVPAQIAESSSEMLVTNSYDLPWVRNWSEGGVLLLGDAAHTAAPATGQGASLALEDGLVLGKAVRDHSTLADAVAAFETARRDRAQANIIASARMSVGDGALSDAPQGRALDPGEAAEQIRWDAPLTA